MNSDEQLKEISSLWVRKRVMDFLGVINMYLVVTSTLAVIAGVSDGLTIAVIVMCSFALVSTLNNKRQIQIAMRKLLEEIGDDE